MVRRGRAAILGGLLSPTSGRVERFAPVVDKDIAWVMQQTSVLGYRSVRDNVALAIQAADSRQEGAHNT